MASGTEGGALARLGVTAPAVTTSRSNMVQQRGLPDFFTRFSEAFLIEAVTFVERHSQWSAVADHAGGCANSHPGHRLARSL